MSDLRKEIIALGKKGMHRAMLAVYAPEILALISQKLPEKNDEKMMAKLMEDVINGRVDQEERDIFNMKVGYNQALSEVRSILESGGEPNG